MHCHRLSQPWNASSEISCNASSTLSPNVRSASLKQCENALLPIVRTDPGRWSARICLQDRKALLPISCRVAADANVTCFRMGIYVGMERSTVVNIDVGSPDAGIQATAHDDVRGIKRAACGVVLYCTLCVKMRCRRRNVQVILAMISLCHCQAHPHVITRTCFKFTQRWNAFASIVATVPGMTTLPMSLRSLNAYFGIVCPKCARSAHVKWIAIGKCTAVCKMATCRILPSLCGHECGKCASVRGIGERAATCGDVRQDNEVKYTC